LQYHYWNELPIRACAKWQAEVNWDTWQPTQSLIPMLKYNENLFKSPRQVIPRHSCTVAARTLNATAKHASNLYESSCDALLNVHPAEHDRQSKALNKIQT
jgi:hypothetical protein